MQGTKEVSGILQRKGSRECWSVLERFHGRGGDPGWDSERRNHRAFLDKGRHEQRPQLPRGVWRAWKRPLRRHVALASLCEELGFVPQGVMKSLNVAVENHWNSSF